MWTVFTGTMYVCAVAEGRRWGVVLEEGGVSYGDGDERWGEGDEEGKEGRRETGMKVMKGIS